MVRSSKFPFLLQSPSGLSTSTRSPSLSFDDSDDDALSACSSRDMQRPTTISRTSSMSAFAARISPSASRLNLGALTGSRKEPSLLPSVMTNVSSATASTSRSPGGSSAASESTPMFCGLPLKYVSLLVLAIQNAALSIVMHYSRVSTPASKSYSPASAVLLNELLKGTISFVIAFMRTSNATPASPTSRRSTIGMPPEPPSRLARLRQLTAEILAPDCFKLSIPAILYVIQNSLQFVAISNLPVASFQVAYQMKILTTAAFSVMLLRKRISTTKWLSLFFLALGVGIVQIQTAAGNTTVAVQSHSEAVGSAAAAAPPHMHVMNPLKGFAAVTAACFTSGLAGVYFEMVLKNSKADLWVRNVQLSLFSLIPALLPIIYSSSSSKTPKGMFGGLLDNFGAWAWATVAIQVFGGLVTAIVIKYSDNILKGFATSLSIILSFLASVVLFDFHITGGFLLGSSTVLIATWMYNQPAPRENAGYGLALQREKADAHVIDSPVGRHEPIIGEKPIMRKSSSFGSTQSLSTFFGLSPASSLEKEKLARGGDTPFLSIGTRTPQFGVSPLTSRSPSPPSSEPSTPSRVSPSHGQWRP